MGLGPTPTMNAALGDRVHEVVHDPGGALYFAASGS